MKREIEIDNGIISGEECDKVQKILPALKGQFRQRKQYYEYYFDSKVIDLTLEQLELLTREFRIELNSTSLIIKIDW